MAKKTVSAKKRVVKVDAQGQLHVHSSFNNIIVFLPTARARLSAGQALVRWVSVAARKILPMLPRWLPRIAPRLLTTSVCAK